VTTPGLAAPAPDPWMPPPASNASTSQRHRGAYWIAVLVSAALLVGGSISAVSGYLASSSPGGVVRGYFQALARGDAAGALGYGSVPPGEHAYLTADVLRAELAVGSISDIAVGAVTLHGVQASVNISYLLGLRAGPQQVSDVVNVVHSDRRWRLAESAIRANVTLAQAANRATFAGAALPTDRPVLFPGALPVSFDTPTLQMAGDSGILRFAGSESLDLRVEVSASGTGLIEAAVDRGLAACVAATVATALCPVPSGPVPSGPVPSAATRAVPGSLRGTLVAGATIVRTTVGEDSPDGTIDISGSFVVNGTYQALDYDNLASTATGKRTVTFYAHCYATSAGTIVWGAS
jgi:hypothetical protein